MAALNSLSHIPFTSIVMLLLFVATHPTALSQDPITPGPTIADCSPRLVALMPCAPFVQGTAQMPAQSCCDNLNQLYTLQPGCLCLLLNDTTLSDFPINRTRALQLPVLCKLQANASACSGVPSPPGSEVSLGAQHNSSVAASPMVHPTVPVAPRPSIMGLGFSRSNAGRLKTKGLSTMVTFAAILLSKLALLY
ncbi:Bifunctional inhibitor/plant lipid transfer protein/seed storage helical domain - like 10 [Theobroma cacao]|uniref:Bifunctional inhibitor/lipid-transfer protein/seed storage 2S albumin superfamily protein, putative n=1 Tax=Theobroma cacao TaxID=3641 RepID=A0A061FV88_THECC|nr:Bifunctional inhibitor/lipid-transfer protein/seed storage 2S albumin superfamily protein, putative [Theobroma cacao]WRX17349.1 Bifunctional inhibitor/plant lipid transfer protein/seed storage helical domain - like 10 [Theobroma cacao]